MLTFITQNAGTIIVGLIVLALVVLIIRSMIADKKAGKSSCGGNCGCCGNGAACHSHTTSVHTNSANKR